MIAQTAQEVKTNSETWAQLSTAIWPDRSSKNVFLHNAQPELHAHKHLSVRAAKKETDIRSSSTFPRLVIILNVITDDCSLLQTHEFDGVLVRGLGGGQTLV